MTDQITLSAATVTLLSDACKAEIAAHLGLAPTSPLATPSTIAAVPDDGWDYAEFGLQAARAFLQGCSDRTKEVLALMVTEDSFSLRALEREAKAGESGLRGVWTGLTKRTRTITGDPSSALIIWDEVPEKGDFIGRLTPVTLDSFRRALAE
ncbi:hypothetical protein [Sphingomonas sp.]|jgi:hypothetical protein|uniref:hypothetical protein n=1 Tax=Sphingomonas sp. TaxID=28214 RepID=UPI002EDB423D